MVLVDTSVWISHFRDIEDGLVELLSEGVAVCHPFVIGELACGNLQNRTGIVSLLKALPAAPMVEHDEVLAFVEARALMGKGLGYVDVHLLASAVLIGVSLWTHDRKLAKVAAELHCAFGQE
jgi:predicted nucleic acid-binding protein